MSDAAKKRQRKTYWQKCACDTPGSRDAIKSWFSPMSDGMIPYRAELLCDIETDAEKRLRAFMTNKAGQRFEFTRSRNGRNVNVSIKPIAMERPK